MDGISNGVCGGNTFAIFQLIAPSADADIQKVCGMVGLEILIVGFIVHILNATQHDVCISRFQCMVDFCKKVCVVDIFRLFNHYGNLILLYPIKRVKSKIETGQR